MNAAGCLLMAATPIASSDDASHHYSTGAFWHRQRLTMRLATWPAVAWQSCHGAPSGRSPAPTCGTQRDKRACENAGYRTSPNEVTSRSMVDSLRRNDFIYGVLSLHSRRLCSGIGTATTAHSRLTASASTRMPNLKEREGRAPTSYEYRAHR